MTKIDKTDIDNIKLILNESKIENVSKFRIKKGEYEIEISSEQLDKSIGVQSIKSQSVKKVQKIKLKLKLLMKKI